MQILGQDCRVGVWWKKTLPSVERKPNCPALQSGKPHRQEVPNESQVQLLIHPPSTLTFQAAIVLPNLQGCIGSSVEIKVLLTLQHLSMSTCLQVGPKFQVVFGHETLHHPQPGPDLRMQCRSISCWATLEACI